MSLAARLIKDARTAASMTQAELAQRAGTSQPTIAAYEAGDKVPNASTLERVLRATGTTLTTSRTPAARPGVRLRRLLEQRRDEVVDVAARHHAHNVRVFGSVARGEETEGSDIDLLVDMENAAEAAEELVGRGRTAWDEDRLLRLAGEAVIGRIADASNRLPDEVKVAVPDVPWDDIRDIRILVDLIYHRVDYDALWETLATDVPDLLMRLRRWRGR
jgi:transcriptional regulator with XRE-family HTH domain